MQTLLIATTHAYADAGYDCDGNCNDTDGDGCDEFESRAARTPRRELLDATDSDDMYVR